MTERILRVNSQTSGNALLIDTCNDFRGMNAPTIQPISLDEEGKLKYRSQGGLVGIYTEKTLDEIIEALEALRPYVKKYESAQKRNSGVSMEKALQTLISIGHSEAEARRILKLDQKEDEGEDLPDDIKITLQVLLDNGVSKQEAYKKLGLTKQGKIDRRRRK